MGDSAGMVPIKLSVIERPTDPAQEWARTMGRAWGLARLSEGDSAETARRQTGSQNVAFLEGLQSAYDDLNVGRANVEAPSKDVKRRAQSLIGSLTVRRRRFHWRPGD